MLFLLMRSRLLCNLIKYLNIKYSVEIIILLLYQFTSAFKSLKFRIRLETTIITTILFDLLLLRFRREC